LTVFIDYSSYSILSCISVQLPSDSCSTKETFHLINPIIVQGSGIGSVLYAIITLSDMNVVL